MVIIGLTESILRYGFLQVQVKNDLYQIYVFFFHTMRIVIPCDQSRCFVLV